jgi:cytochrome c biogenesis protein CcdA
MTQASLSNGRTFRFPRLAILTMVLGYAGTVLASEVGRVSSAGDSPDTTPIYRVFGALLAVFAVPCIAAVIGSLISLAQQRKPRL